MTKITTRRRFLIRAHLIGCKGSGIKTAEMDISVWALSENEARIEGRRVAERDARLWDLTFIKATIVRRKPKGKSE